MRARALHPDVLAITSAVLQLNCVIVRGEAAAEPPSSSGEGEPKPVIEVIEPGLQDAPEGRSRGETFVIDSPALPDELDALPALVDQARYPAPSGLLATHADWDHVLARLAFPDLALGCAETSARRLLAAPGEAQRALRAFDEELMIERPRPLALGSVQALPVPGRCDIGDREIELHPADGHTADGMAILIGWAGVLVVGDYLSAVEIPMISEGGALDAYRATLERLRPLLGRVAHVVPGHGPVLDTARATEILEEDLAYLSALGGRGADAQPPASRRGPAQRRIHDANLAAL